MSWFSDQWSRWASAGAEALGGTSRTDPAHVRRLEVSFGKQRFPLQVPQPTSGAPATLRDLKTLVAAQTGVPVDEAKLIHNGLVLRDDRLPLSAFGLRDGSRLMLVGTSGGAAVLGDRPGARGSASASGSTTSGGQAGSNTGGGASGVGARSKGEQLAREKRMRDEDTSEQGQLERIALTLNGVRRELTAEVEALERAASRRREEVEQKQQQQRGTGSGEPDSGAATTAAAMRGTDAPKSDPRSGALANLYRKVNELLVRALLALDGVPANTEATRAARKAAVKEVQALLDRVDTSWGVLKL